MSAQHTPGPWRAACWTGHAATTVVVDDATAPAGKRVVAECATEDDARLIAAVLELQAALLAYVEWDVGCSVSPMCDTPEYRGAIAALAKGTVHA